jgi:hypothetical protein
MYPPSWPRDKPLPHGNSLTPHLCLAYQYGRVAPLRITFKVSDAEPEAPQRGAEDSVSRRAVAALLRRRSPFVIRSGAALMISNPPTHPERPPRTSGV